MRHITVWVRHHPTRASAVAAVLIGWLGLVVPDEITTGLSTILGVILGTTVWGAVTPVARPATLDPSEGESP